MQNYPYILTLAQPVCTTTLFSIIVIIRLCYRYDKANRLASGAHTSLPRRSHEGTEFVTRDSSSAASSYSPASFASFSSEPPEMSPPFERADSDLAGSLDDSVIQSEYLQAQQPGAKKSR